MPHCTKCGAAVAEGAGFCGNCGTPLGSAQAAAPSPTAGQPAPGSVTPASTQPGIAENVAGALCYVLGWLTGLIFFFIDKRPFVRFHAAQSIVVFGALNILLIVLGAVFGISMMAAGWAGISIGWAIYGLVELVVLVLWIVLMIKAYQGQKFRVPVAADVAESIAGKA
jgi:uncharacterized membrane protein